MKTNRFSRPVKRIVIKIGSALITDKGKISLKNINKYTSLIKTFRDNKYEIILVSSGAVASAAFPRIKLSKNLALPRKQALSSIGQVNLMEIYKKKFSRYKIKIGQILISESALKNRRSYLNARNTIFTLLHNKVLPIINENDATATAELTFGGNDMLGALICGLLNADLYLMLSDVDGYYTNFNTPRAKLIHCIDKIDASVYKNAGGPAADGTGGMQAKIKAASICMNLGIPMLIINGKSPKISKAIHNPECGTLFRPPAKQINNRKKWIASGINLQGKIYIDDGAEQALIKYKKSLLPRGITGISGDFHIGDLCYIVNSRHKKIAKGIVNFSSYELKKITGKPSSAFKKILGIKTYDEAINRNNMVILSSPGQ
ncbi:MAG TPA: glutamate 5-kinase [Spirochaetota bacterium]|nr:glutamate 5-kinase [Spirochaetota bacterium]